MKTVSLHQQSFAGDLGVARGSLHYFLCDGLESQTVFELFRTATHEDQSDLCAGGPSIRMLIQRICMAFRGFVNPSCNCKIIDNEVNVRLANDSRKRDKR